MDDDVVDSAPTNLEAQYSDIERLLDSAATGSNQYLSPKTAERWFKETMEQERPRNYFESEIKPRMKEAEQNRHEFDEMTSALEAKGSSASFSILSPTAFWKMRSRERQDYLQQAKDYLKGPKNFESRWSRISEEVRSFVKVTFDELGAASSSESKALLDGLNYKPKDETELEGWETYVKGEMQKQIKAARRLYFEELMDPLLRELSNKTISERVLKEMDKKFRDKNASYKSKESYVRNVLPKRIAEWKKVKAQRDRLMSHPGLKKLTTSKVPKLNKFLNESTFIDMTFPERRGLTDMIESILLSQEKGLEQLHSAIRTELNMYVADGRMHRSKVGTWLNRIFTKNANEEQVRTFMTDTVYPYAENWRIARVDFNKLNQKMKEKGVPRGMHQYTLNEFLLLDYPQKQTYLDEAQSRLESDVNAPGKLNNLIVGIRHNLDTHDWEEATELLEEAKKIAPEDKAVVSIDRYLRAHRPIIVEEKEDMEAQELLDDMRQMVSHIPGMMKKTYIKAMLKGPKVLAAITTGTYNLVWVHEHRYSDPSRDRQASEDENNKEKTRHYIENGHSRKLEHNIIGGDTAHRAAIRDDCKKAQMAHIKDEEGCAVTVDAFEDKQDDKVFQYWTTLHFADVSYDEHREVVQNYNYKLKSGMRALDKLGYRFTLAGEPQSKGV